MNRPGGEGVGEPFSLEIEMVPFYLSADRNNSNKRLMIFRGDFAKQSQYRIAQRYQKVRRPPYLEAAIRRGGKVSGGVGAAAARQRFLRLPQANA